MTGHGKLKTGDQSPEAAIHLSGSSPPPACQSRSIQCRHFSCSALVDLLIVHLISRNASIRFRFGADDNLESSLRSTKVHSLRLLAPVISSTGGTWGQVTDAPRPA